MNSLYLVYFSEIGDNDNNNGRFLDSRDKKSVHIFSYISLSSHVKQVVQRI